MKPLADPQGDSGFTLIEVLVATFIMSVLSVMGVSMLTNTLRTRDQVEVVVEPSDTSVSTVPRGLSVIFLWMNSICPQREEVSQD